MRIGGDDDSVDHAVERAATPQVCSTGDCLQTATLIAQDAWLFGD
jgi:hypothetical protein